MKQATLLLLAFVALGFCPAFSKDFKFPKKGDPLFTISIPDGWSPKFDDEETLEGEDKEGDAYIAVWEEDTETELAKIAGDIDDILNEYARDVKVAGKPEPFKLAGMEGLLFKGTAKDKEDGSGIGFEAIVLVVDKDSAAVIYYDYSQDAPEKVGKQLINILKSVKPAKE
jgi:hypothetical protein